MQTYWIPTRKDDEESFAQYKDRLSGRIPLYFRVTNGLVGGFEVTDWFKETIHIGFLYLQRNEEGVLMQNLYLFDDKDSGNMAIELMDTLMDQQLFDQIDIKYCIDKDGKEETTAILILMIGEYGTLQEDLYSAYFTGHTIRPYGYMKEDYYRRNYTEQELGYTRHYDVTPKISIWKRIANFFAKKEDK